MIFLSTLLLSVLITIAMVPVFSTLAVRWRMVDLPGARKVHARPMPRCGGIAMALGAFVPVLLWNYEETLVQGWLAGALILVAFGVVDDIRGLSAKWKFLGQIAAALVFIFWGGVRIRTLGMLAPDDFLLPGWVAVPLTLLAIVGVTNAINLADGLDGLAGGICLLIFTCIGYLAYIEGDTVDGLVALAMAGAIFGFLRFNTHPATVFMGDTGSQLLGFSAVALSLDLTQGNTALSPVLPLILVGIPVLDTLTVMATRIVRGRSPFTADQTHFHHNLMALGLRHTESVTLIYAGQTALVISAFLLRFYSDWLLLTGYLVFSVATIVLLSLAGRNGWHEKLVDVAGQGSSVYRYLQNVKTKGIAIRYAFPALEAGLYLLLLVICVLPAEVPVYVTYSALPFGALILATRIWKKEWAPDALRFTLYLLIPVVVYAGNQACAPWAAGFPMRLCNVSFGVLAILDIAVSKLSKRRDGFKSTPLDFLILLLAVGIPNMPERSLQEFQLGLIAAKIIILYFSFEVLMAEMRRKLDRLAVVTGVALLVLFVRGIL
ncbi:MAG: undecaprenyl/decaprenyl-phosphate alpha-N-acetylglucosaminyl 1-phosphate transferase [Deltaproteobacteria bacterium]|nr:undecaprenyl/decaprenyl-phosphate alpha-N-acetylglucosaminyl 1-phosphate transferase [Deltaproteobacteria bacterium]